MRIRPDATISRDKLVKYLLVSRPWDDKSVFLSRAGYTLANPDDLEHAIRELAASVGASEDARNEYGVFWRVEGELVGPLARLAVELIWMRRQINERFPFVALKPRRVPKKPAKPGDSHVA
ncbi:hypothetical protein RAS1_05720 [Phycisphaerae bacterium RAS1]|nr:hypothetical protein RAS1_05720 [Phycisphaerae bacterium RAS1]